MKQRLKMLRAFSIQTGIYLDTFSSVEVKPIKCWASSKNYACPSWTTSPRARSYVHVRACVCVCLYLSICCARACACMCMCACVVKEINKDSYLTNRNIYGTARVQPHPWLPLARNVSQYSPVGPIKRTRKSIKQMSRINEKSVVHDIFTPYTKYVCIPLPFFVFFRTFLDYLSLIDNLTHYFLFSCLNCTGSTSCSLLLTTATAYTMTYSTTVSCIQITIYFKVNLYSTCLGITVLQQDPGEVSSCSQ